MRYFIHQKIRITDNKIVIEDPSKETIKNLKNKNYNRKMNPLNNKGKIARRTFCGSKFHWEKTVQMPQKNIIIIYDYMNN